MCSTRNVEIVRSLGADHVIDYWTEDFTRRPERYDLILAANGYHPISAYLGVLRPGGGYGLARGSMRQALQAATRKRLASAGTHDTDVISLEQRQEDLILIQQRLDTRKLTPVIDGCYPLNQTAEAMRSYEQDRSQGKIVLTVEHSL